MKHKGNKNLTYTQRLQIETLFKAKMKQKDIAKQVGVSLRTIQYELKRGEYMHTYKRSSFWYKDRYYKVKNYSADLSYERYKNVCTSKGRPLKVGKDFDFVRYIDNRCYKDKISACAVLGEINRNNLFKTHISKTTLYRYIKLGLFEHLKFGKHKVKYKQVRIKRAPRGTSIEKRPKEIFKRTTFGHWEMDCVCGSTKTCLLVLSERLTRKELIFKIDRQTSCNVVSCINLLEQKYGNNFYKIFKSITVDNGSEFSDCKGIETSFLGDFKRTTVYYCHPYTSYIYKKGECNVNEQLLCIYIN